MARIRTIKPEIWADEKFSALDTLSQLVFIGLISQADDAGRLPDSVRLIDGALWPFDESRTCRESLANLSRIGLIQRGKTKSGQRVIQVVGWASHQRVDKPNLKATLPPIASCGNGLRDSENDSRPIRESFANDSVPIPTTYDLRSTTDERDTRTHAREAVENSDPFALLEPINAAAIRGLYGWTDREGTDERVWGDTPRADRPRLLQIAVQRLVGEGRAYQGKLFRRILEAVVAEQVSTVQVATNGSGSYDLSHWDD